MSARNSGSQATHQSRRRFLKQSVGVVGAAAAVSAAGPLLEVGTLSASEAPPDQSYRTPSYLPPGYELLAIAEDVEGEAGQGCTERIIWYADPNVQLSVDLPLAVYQSPKPRVSWLASLQLDGGKPLQMPLPSGATVPAKYTEGWTVRKSPDEEVWDTSNFHALTCSFNGLVVAVRGSRRVGISFDELLRVASSMAEPL